MPKLTLLELCDRLYELDSTIENLSQEDLPFELVEAMDNLLEDRNTAIEEYYEKINSILNLIKNEQQWAQIRKQRIKELQRLVKIDEHLSVKVNQYLLDHLCQEKADKCGLGLRPDKHLVQEKTQLNQRGTRSEQTPYFIPCYLCSHEI